MSPTLSFVTMTLTVKLLFGLIPMNEDARCVVENNSNTAYHAWSSRDEEHLVFGPDHYTKTPGTLVTFGRHENNDVRLPSFPHPRRGRAASGETSALAASNGFYQNYGDDHFFFFLAESGELILRDLSPPLVRIAVDNANPEETTLYALHGSPERGPRQRVIPRTTRPIYITFGTNTCFKLKWFPDPVTKNEYSQAYLAARARSLAVPGMNLTPPLANLEPPGLHSMELRSHHTPSVASKSVPYKSIHKYQQLGSGGFGVVWKVVDLSSGELWAVKEINTTMQVKRKEIGHAKGYDFARKGVIESVKASLIQEVENMATISHVSSSSHYLDFRMTLNPKC